MVDARFVRRRNLILAPRTGNRCIGPRFAPTARPCILPACSALHDLALTLMTDRDAARGPAARSTPSNSASAPGENVAEARPTPPGVHKPHTVVGDLRIHEFQSTILGASRTVAVWLPPGYNSDNVSRFSVLYLHDGQNVFDSATAFGAEWQVDETATGLIQRGEIDSGE